MTRIKRGVTSHRRHKRLLKETKGFWGQRSNIVKRARETLMRARAYAYKGRRLRKREFRALFIARINAAARTHGLSYNNFVAGLRREHVSVNRKMLSQLAIYDPALFAHLVTIARG
jgi:large subunit ribosomal protein L20